MTPNLLPFLAFNHGSNFWFIPGVSVPFPSAKIFVFVLARLGKDDGRNEGRRTSKWEKRIQGEKPTLKKKNQEGRKEKEREEGKRNRETERKSKHQGKERRAERGNTTTEAKTNDNKGVKGKNDNSP